jgi:hypothetical protein
VPGLCWTTRSFFRPASRFQPHVSHLYTVVISDERGPIRNTPGAAAPLRSPGLVRYMSGTGQSMTLTTTPSLTSTEAYHLWGSG